jgi:hypothetical protein
MNWLQKRENGSNLPKFSANRAAIDNFIQLIPSPLVGEGQGEEEYQKDMKLSGQMPGQRPKLNATRIRRPKVILLMAIASKSRIKASGHGTIPPENPREIR